MMVIRKRITIFDVPVDPITLPELFSRIDTAISGQERSTILYVNVRVLNLAYENERLRRILNRADLVYCDGAGVRWAARLQGEHLPVRMTGADWIWDLCAWAEEKKYSLFFLGGEEGVAEQACRRLKDKFKDLRIAGNHQGYFCREGQDNDRVVDMINESSSQILLVGMGSPIQEEWMEENFSHLNTPIIWGMGAVLDYVSGEIPRAPRWMLNHSLEWVYRLLIEPKRLWKRYLIGNPLFFLRIIKHRITAHISMEE